MARNAKSYAALLAAVGGAGLFFCESQIATATILTGPVDVIYQDNFAGPPGGTNVNASTTPPNAIAGNNAAVETGLDGGSTNSPYLGFATPLPAGPTAGSDAVWQYSGSGASITSPSANIATTGNVGEDAKTITNLTLPFVPVVGAGYTYDLEATLNLTTATGAHGLEMAYLYNAGNMHNNLADAISNNDPVGLILDRDAVSGGGYFDIFEGSGTANDTHFAPTATALTGGSPGTTVTVDILYTPSSSTAGSLSWYLNGQLANVSPVAVSGLTGGISYIQFGDNQDAGATFSNFSLTAQSSVPEPAVAGLFVASGMILSLRRRNRTQVQ